jgi:uncharacterized protein
MGFHHESINEGVAAIKHLAQRNNFTVDWQEDAKLINNKKIKK